MFCHMAAASAYKNKVVWMIAHRRELIQQISLTFADFAISAAVVAPPQTVRMIKVKHFKKYGRSYVDHRSKLFIASIQTLIRNHKKLPAPDLIIIDEAHHAIEKNTWGAIIKEYPLAKLLLVSATPCRTDQSGLGVGHGGFADIMLHGPSMRWLIDRGYLSDYVVYGAQIEGAKTDGFKKRFGENAKKEVEAEYAKPKIIGCAVDHYISTGKGLPLVAFTAGVENAKRVAAEYRARGIKVQSLDGSMESSDRTDYLSALADGTLQGLTSSDLIGEGLDIPGIVVAQLLRPTLSLVVCRQQIGRALRPMPGKKHAIILDHVGNIGTEVNGAFVPKHGFPDEEIEWSLEGAKRKPRKNDVPAVSVMRCHVCYAMFKPASNCPQCGAAMIAGQQRQEIKQVEGTLIEITPEQRKAQQIARRIDIRKCRTYEELLAYAEQQGYQYPQAWARKQLSIREQYKSKRATV